MFKRTFLFLICGIAVATIGMIVIRRGVTRVSMEVVGPRLPSDSTVVLLFTNPGPKEVLCLPKDLARQIGGVSWSLSLDSAEVLVLQAGQASRYTLQLPREAKYASEWQVRYHCHERATGIAGIVETNASRGFPWWLLYRLVDKGFSFVDGNTETPFNGPEYDVVSSVATEGVQPSRLNE